MCIVTAIFFFTLYCWNKKFCCKTDTIVVFHKNSVLSMSKILKFSFVNFLKERSKKVYINYEEHLVSETRF